MWTMLYLVFGGEQQAADEHCQCTVYLIYLCYFIYTSLFFLARTQSSLQHSPLLRCYLPTNLVSYIGEAERA